MPDNIYLGPLNNQIAAEHGGADNCWYNWSCKHWGCKWDATIDEYTVDKPCLAFHWESPWSTPTPFVIKLVAELGKLATLTWYFEEEFGWGGEMRWKEGELIYEKMWDRVPHWYSEDDPGHEHGTEDTYEYKEEEEDEDDIQ